MKLKELVYAIMVCDTIKNKDKVEAARYLLNPDTEKSDAP